MYNEHIFPCLSFASVPYFDSLLEHIRHTPSLVQRPFLMLSFRAFCLPGLLNELAMYYQDKVHVYSPPGKEHATLLSSGDPGFLRERCLPPSNGRMAGR